MSNDSDLQALYPFLHGKPQDPAALDAALLHSVEEKAGNSREPMRASFGEQAAILVAAAKALADVYRRGGRMFSMGNGGSSCDASHIAVEFVHPITAGRPALAAINLVADLAMISAVGNDVGFEHVFVASGHRTGESRRRPDRHFHQRQFVESDHRFRQSQGDGTRDHRSRWRRWRPDEVEPAYAIIAWSSRRPRSTASRSATSRPITSSGISCTRCWPTIADRRRRRRPQHEICRRISRPRQGADPGARDRASSPLPSGCRNAVRSRSWRCAAGTRIRSSATASKGCCRKRSNWCMGPAARCAFCRWAGSTIASRSPNGRR